LLCECNFNSPVFIIWRFPFTFAIDLFNYTMKKFTGILFFALCFGIAGFSQTQYETLVERPGEKTLKGILSREVLETDTSFKWYKENEKAYTPNSLALQALRQYGDSVQLLVFMGTWCEDSHFVIPKLFKLMDVAGFSTDRVTLIGVDRAKKTLSHLTDALQVKNVPTIMVMKDGKEMGRVVEYGKYGMWDKEMGEVINAAFK
jgi:thiol-disulfide isomerase/thioredoxin